MKLWVKWMWSKASNSVVFRRAWKQTSRRTPCTHGEDRNLSKPGQSEPKGQGGYTLHSFSRFVNPISNRGAEYADHITNCPLQDFQTFLRACKLMGLKGQYILRRSLSWLQGLPSVVLSLIMKEDHTHKKEPNNQQNNAILQLLHCSRSMSDSQQHFWNKSIRAMRQKKYCEIIFGS